jgi:pyruvate-formate lyase-activating enzyme
MPNEVLVFVSFLSLSLGRISFRFFSALCQHRLHLQVAREFKDHETAALSALSAWAKLLPVELRRPGPIGRMVTDVKAPRPKKSVFANLFKPKPKPACAPLTTGIMVRILTTCCASDSAASHCPV